MGGHDSEIGRDDEGRNAPPVPTKAAVQLRADRPAAGWITADRVSAGSGACAANPIRAIQQVSARGGGAAPRDLFSNFGLRFSYHSVGVV